MLVEEPSYLAALQAFALAARARAGAVRRRRARPGRGRRGGAPARRPAALHGPDVPQPDRPHAAAERRRALAAVAERAGLWLLEDDPYGELRYRGEPLPRRRVAARRRGPHAGALDAVEGRRARACGSAGCERRERCAGRWSSPSRRPTCTPRPSTRPPRRGGSPAVDLDAHIAGCARPTARAATRCSTASPPRCRRARPTTAPTAACSCGRGCPTAGTPTTLLTPRARPRRRVRARLAVLRRRRRTAPRCASLSRPTRRTEIAEGLARLHAAWH